MKVDYGSFRILKQLLLLGFESLEGEEDLNLSISIVKRFESIRLAFI